MPLPFRYPMTLDHAGIGVFLFFPHLPKYIHAGETYEQKSGSTLSLMTFALSNSLFLVFFEGTHIQGGRSRRTAGTGKVRKPRTVRGSPYNLFSSRTI